MKKLRGYFSWILVVLGALILSTILSSKVETEQIDESKSIMATRIYALDMNIRELLVQEVKFGVNVSDTAIAVENARRAASIPPEQPLSTLEKNTLFYTPLIRFQLLRLGQFKDWDSDLEVRIGCYNGTINSEIKTEEKFNELKLNLLPLDNPECLQMLRVKMNTSNPYGTISSVNLNGNSFYTLVFYIYSKNFNIIDTGTFDPDQNLYAG